MTPDAVFPPGSLKVGEVVRLRATGELDESLAEVILLPEPFPYGAELVLAQYVLRQALKREARDD